MPKANLRLAVCCTALTVAFAMAAPRLASAQTTALFMDSQTGDYIGGAVKQTFTPADGTFRAPVGRQEARIVIRPKGSGRRERGVEDR